MSALPSGEHAWIIYIAVALLLAVVGNAIWEYLLRPLFSRCPRLIWTGISHVSRRLANSIVQQAARRRDPALRIVLFVSCSMIATAFGITVGIAGRLVWVPPGSASISAEYQAAESLPLSKREAALQALAEHLATYRAETELGIEHELEYPALIFSVVLALVFFDAFKVSVAYVMASKFEWLLQIRKAALSDAQIRELEWKWAAMQTTDDLDRVWKMLTS